MRLTADVIVHARASINPCDERELDLRGYKIPMIENLGVTQDQFDAIDFSDNEIKKVDNFPRYRRLSSLLLCNNHVSRIAADLGAQLPNLSCLILTNNKLNSLGDLDGLRSCKKLTMLSLLHNEVVNKQYYRLYAINLVPSLKQLDFQKVTIKERESAGRLARSQAGQAMMQDVAKEAEKAKTFTPGGGAAAAREGLTAEHRRIYAERIEKAATVEEVELLTRKFQAGIVPSATYKQGGGAVVANGIAPPSDSSKPAAVSDASSTVVAVGAHAVGKGSKGVPDLAVPPPAAEPVAAPAAVPEATAPVAELPDTAVGANAMDVDGEQAEEERKGEEKAEPESDVGVEAEAEAEVPLPTEEDAGVAVAAADEGRGGGSDDSQSAAAAAAVAGEADRADSAPESDAMDEGEGEGETAIVAEGADRAEVAPEGQGEVVGAQQNGEGDEKAVTAEAGDGEGGEEDGEEEEEEGDDGAGGEQPEGGGGEPTLSEAEIKKFKVADLKKKLVELDLSTAGLKADLQARLLEAMGY